MPKRRHIIDSPSLFPEPIPSWETNGIFSDHFIRAHLQEVPLYPSDDEHTRQLYEYIKELWEKKHVILGKNNEELTKREFLEKIFDKLGFAFIPARKLPVTDKRREPDYLFFQDEATKEKAFACELIDQYRLSITLLEAKKVNHPLDEVSKKETPGKFPHQQVRDYLSYAADQYGNPFFKWAILTNGGVWRLYNRDSHPSSYFQFRLAGEKYFCSYEDFKIFFTLFRPESFIPTDGICPLDDIRKEAIQYQTALEEDLRKRIFTVIADLANGFWSNKDNNMPEADLTEVYDNCLIFLYRLLFVLYAESRGLLPVRPYGAGANKNYRERYSLKRFTPLLRQGLDYQSDEFEVVNRLSPFKTIGDIWISTTAGLKLEESEYHNLAKQIIASPKQKTSGKEEWLKIEKQLAGIKEQINPFHWELEFPDIFFDRNGMKKADSGFDAIPGNPPYISTQSSSGFAYREGLEYLFGFADDLYVHFVFKGFDLLKHDGMFGFIISDTFFTLSTKQRLRELFQEHNLSFLVQCGPFKATVDTSVFVAEKAPVSEQGLVFIQARYGKESSKPGNEIINFLNAMPEGRKNIVQMQWQSLFGLSC